MTVCNCCFIVLVIQLLANLFHKRWQVNNQLSPLPPPRSPASSDTAASLSPDEKEGFDSENDKGLMKYVF